MNKFEKVSFEQFAADTEKLMGLSSDDPLVREIYDEIVLPKRGSAKSAGYDFRSPFYFNLDSEEGTIIIPTGIKCQLNDDSTLLVFPRSSMGIKKNMFLANTVGIIDSDYYNNESNEGHIMLAIKNIGYDLLKIEANDKIVQGLIFKYEITDDDDANGIRTGGIGSTGE